jgi:hypothetical protein
MIANARRAQDAPIGIVGVRGLGERALNRLAEEFCFDAIAAAFPERGDTKLLKHIAWYGSVLADIMNTSNIPSHVQSLESGALFNLAVAVFDSCVDVNNETARSLAVALSPQNLSARLRNPGRTDLAIRSDSADADLVCQLFDRVLSTVGQRFVKNQEIMSMLENLLSRMYYSETSPGSCRTDAKALPVCFICMLADGPRALSRERFHVALGNFIALLDDWQDLADDLRNGNANSFVYSYDRRLWRAAIYVTSAAVGAIADGLTAGSRMRWQLRSSLQNVLDSAQLLETSERSALLWTLGHLLGVA